MLRRRTILILAIVVIVLISSTAFAGGLEEADTNAQRFGFWTLLPPLIAILLSFVTRNVIVSLFIGVLSGTILLQLNGHNVVGGIVHGFLMVIDTVIGSLSDPWNAGIVLQCLAIGGLIALISKLGGARAITDRLSQKAKSPRSAQLITWLLGLFIFFDDYANALIIGPIMRPVTDKFKISRERLAFIIDGTAAPIAGMALISTWIGYELSLIKEGYDLIGQEVNSYGVFVETIPFRFYNILMLVFIVATTLLLREFGPMLKAERRARKTGKVLSENSRPMVSTTSEGFSPKEGIRLSIWNAIIPIAVLIIGALVGFYFNGYQAIMGGEDKVLIDLLNNSPISFQAIRETFGKSDASIVLFQSALLAGIVAIIMGVAQKIFTLEEALSTWIEGIKSLVITGVILLLAWSLSSVIKELGTSRYLVSAISGSIPKPLLPSIIFILGAIISFATGTSFGTMGILMPLTIPLAYAILPENGYVIICISGVLTGAIFGDHCSPISDTSILSSMGAACGHMDHVKTQIYYSLVVAVVTILFGYLPAGFGIPVYIVLPIAVVAVIGVIYLLGRRVEEFSEEEIEVI